MDLYWEMERLRALQEDTPHIWEQQSGFLRHVVQPNNDYWMPEPYFPSPTYYDFHQEPEPSEEEQLVDMFKDWFKKQDKNMDAIFHSQAESIQRMTDQVR